MAIIVSKVVQDTKTALLMLPEKNETVERTGRNIADFKVSNISNINVLDLVNYKHLILLEGTVEALIKKYR